MPSLPAFPVSYVSSGAAHVSTNRDLVSPEQYLTIAIPGEAIDTRLIEKGGTFVYGVENSAFVPPQVRQAEARLVDKMMPLANVMVLIRS